MRSEAIFALYPNVISVDEEHGCFDSSGNLATIDEVLVSAKIAELQAEYDANKYQRQRAGEYPSWQDQLDKIYHDGVMSWQKEIKAIKDKYPKS